MTTKFNKVHNRFKFNGLHFSFEELKEVAYSLVKEGEPYEKEIGNFLIDWLNPKTYVFVNTSGSTGTPKQIKLKKQAMVNSAIATGDFFELQPGDTALHCLPSHYIAGKMMLVRALILGLEIDCIKPVAHPLFDNEKQYNFCAMIPLQLEKTIGYTQNIDKIIIGGAKVNKSLQQKIKKCKSKFYETYGMTETATHVAVRQLESQFVRGHNYFNALTNIRFSQDKRQCLVIRAPKLVNESIVTNDIVDLKSETSFQLKGRYDNVINSGGIKLFPEQIEEKLQPIIKERFFIAGKPDDTLGEKLILIIENPYESVDAILSKIKDLKTLNKFEMPKHIYTLDKFLETDSGKILRNKTFHLAIA